MTLGLADLVNYYNLFQILNVYTNIIQSDKTQLKKSQNFDKYFKNEIEKTDVFDMYAFIRANLRRVITVEENDDIEKFLKNYRTIFEKEMIQNKNSIESINANKLQRLY